MMMDSGDNPLESPGAHDVVPVPDLRHLFAEGPSSPRSDEGRVFEEMPCLPGQRLCDAGEGYEAGDGTYLFTGTIYASILGFLHVEPSLEKAVKVVSVQRKQGMATFTPPTIGSRVTCVVTARNRYVCNCAITHVGQVKLDHRFRGVIRRKFIYEKSRVLPRIEDNFGVGDTVLARIVGIIEGDFVLSTAEEELGVALATSEEGFNMIPVNWTQMQCPKSGERMDKKVAKMVLLGQGEKAEDEIAEGTVEDTLSIEA